MHKKNILIILILILATYVPILFNQFVGDDHTLFEKNTFYKSWKNVPRLFEKGYIVDLSQISYSSETQADYGTGSVSYRPISNLTYFFDNALFQAKPYGSHLIGILIHCANAILIYWIVCKVVSSSMLGLFSALLFSLHPIQSEAVAVMSYRADIVAAFFVLCSFCFWVKFKEGECVRRGYYGWALVMYLLAVLSKESAIVLPLVIICFDRLLAVSPSSLKVKTRYYLGFVFIFLFHLYIYFIVFPNSTFYFHWLGGSLIKHCLILGYIWYTYLINILLPWTVKLIPGLYCPPAPSLISLISAKLALAVFLLVAALSLIWRYSRPAVFFLLWYIIFYLPVSNLLPIANPIATRFMYLPSIGILVVLAWAIFNFFDSDMFKKYSRRLPRILMAGMTALCITCTLFLNADWKSDFDVAYAWVKNYPSVYRGYGLLGKVYFFMGNLKEARIYLEKSVLMGDQIPSNVFNLAQCYRGLGQLTDAQALLKQIIEHNPEYADPYFESAVIYYLQHNVPLEEEMLGKGLALNPKKSMMYFPLMKIYINSGNWIQADKLLKIAAFNLSEDEVKQLRQLKR